MSFPLAQSWRSWRGDLSLQVSLAVWVGLAPSLKAWPRSISTIVPSEMSFSQLKPLRIIIWICGDSKLQKCLEFLPCENLTCQN